MIVIVASALEQDYPPSFDCMEPTAMRGQADDSKSPVNRVRRKRRGNVQLPKSHWLSSIWEKSRVESLALCLIVMSLLDLLLTYVLLNSYAEVYEANPVVLWFFHRWNIFGMTIFKFALVGVVIVASEILERRHRGLGRVILIFACIAAAVVVYKGLQIFLGLSLGGFSIA